MSQNLEAFYNVKALWLDNNKIARIENLEHMTQLHVLYVFVCCLSSLLLLYPVTAPVRQLPCVRQVFAAQCASSTRKPRVREGVEHFERFVKPVDVTTRSWVAVQTRVTACEQQPDHVAGTHRGMPVHQVQRCHSLRLGLDGVVMMSLCAALSTYHPTDCPTLKLSLQCWNRCQTFETSTSKVCCLRCACVTGADHSSAQATH